MNPRHQAFLVIVASAAFLLTGCSYSKSRKTSLVRAAATGTQKEIAFSLKRYRSQPEAQLGVLLDAADKARAKLRTNPNDSNAQSDYNYAISGIVNVIDKSHLSPWKDPVECPSESGDAWSFRVKEIQSSTPISYEDLKIVPSDMYEFKGTLVGERTVKQGVGAPVIAIVQDPDFSKKDEFLQKHIYYGLTGILQANGRQMELVFVDPLMQESVTLDDHVYPLGADFEAPLALTLAELKPKKDELAGMFKPQDQEGSAHLARLQPYDPDKIPVLVIHGLGCSPATWMPLIASLRNDAVIRTHYQFWFYGYPTGLPYPLSAAILRHKLDLFNERYPDHKDMVVIGHSMGGMISRLLISDSGMKIWDTFYERPPEEMPFDEDARIVMTQSLIFKARPDIARVIYCSASHRGSEDASNFTGRLGAQIVGNPLTVQHISDEAIGYVRAELKSNSFAPFKKNRFPNSIDVLNPDSTFLKVVDTLPPKPGIPYHSIIGDRGRGGNLDHTRRMSSDGIVPYWSSHLDGASSEKIIPSDHFSHQHPLGMAEIKRILKLHVAEQ